MKKPKKKPTKKELKKAITCMSGAMFLDYEEVKAWNLIADFVEEVLKEMEEENE